MTSLPFQRPPRGLYAISTSTPDTAGLLAWAAAVIDGGAIWLQYRDKHGAPALRLAQARGLRAMCRERGVPLIVNDDVELAQAVGADGLHLGERDAAIADARMRLGHAALIGASCYDDLARAAAMASAGADYLAFGAFHPSATKPQARQAEPTLLREARVFGKPRVAIGGITPDNGGALVTAGADLLAVVGGLAGPPDAARAAARRYAALFD